MKYKQFNQYKKCVDFFCWNTEQINSTVYEYLATVLQIMYVIHKANINIKIGRIQKVKKGNLSNIKHNYNNIQNMDLIW